MRSLRAVVAALVAGVVLSGCTGGGPPADADDSDPFAGLTEDAPEVASGKGLIAGVVVDPAIRPLQGANVTHVASGSVFTTDEQGRFTIPDLDPGVHFLKVSLRRHEDTQVSVDVAAGAPTAARVLLVPVAGAEPYLTTLVFRGHIDMYLGAAQFVGELVAPGTLPCTCSWTFDTDPGLRTIVYEATGTASIANPGTPATDDGDAYWELVSRGGEGDIESEYDDFPFSFTFQNETFPEHGDRFLARITGGVMPSGTMDYDLFVTLFYHEEGPEGWSMFSQA